jgi:L-ascorbate metabolism protein UlaG (beta-lactamase superfamily)
MPIRRAPAAAAVAAAVLTTATLALSARPAAGAEVTWYGHSAVRIDTDGGRSVLIDPFLTGNPATPKADRDLSRQEDVDLILLTHGHRDHLGDTAELARRSDAKVAVDADLGSTLRQLGLVPADQLVRFNRGGTIRPIGDAVAVTMTRAVHSSAVVAKDPETGAERVHPGGEAAGFVIEIADGPTFYHAGDTGVFSDMSFIAEYYEPDLAFLPIGGRSTMDPAHAAHALMTYLNVPRVVPIHYASFPELDGTPDQLRDHLGGYPVEVEVMAPGETRAF